MQLLFEASEEGPVGDGVGVVPGQDPAPAGGSGPVKIPHIGWDEVTVRPGSRLFAGLGDGTRFYFVHSYAPEPDGDGRRRRLRLRGPLRRRRRARQPVRHPVPPREVGRAGLALLANFVTQGPLA
jgi:glutamine amidotransferase